jgi:hypothetical protein
MRRCLHGAAIHPHTREILAGLNNGWDQLKDANQQKTAELGIALVPNKTLSLLAQIYYGTEQVNGFTDVVSGTRTLFDWLRLTM